MLQPCDLVTHFAFAPPSPRATSKATAEAERRASADVNEEQSASRSLLAIMLLLLDLALAQFAPAADGSATTFDECKAACASHSECCNDDLNQGSNQKLSCLMCCTIRTRGTSEAECLTTVVDKTDCTITWGDHTYGEDNGLCGDCNFDNSCAAISPNCNNSPNCGTNCALGCRLGAAAPPSLPPPAAPPWDTAPHVCVDSYSSAPINANSATAAPFPEVPAGTVLRLEATIRIKCPHKLTGYLVAPFTGAGLPTYTLWWHKAECRSRRRRRRPRRL